MTKMLRAAGLLIALFGQTLGASATEHRINTWLVLGPFASAGREDFDTRRGIQETQIAPRPDQAEAGRKWEVCDDRLYCRNFDDYVDLFTFFSLSRRDPEATDFQLAYAFVYVWSPADQDVRLRLGANDGYRLWLNGEVLATHFSLRRWAPRDSDAMDARLKRGWNRLLVKIQNGTGIWGFYCKIEDARGRTPPGLEYSLTGPGAELQILSTRLPKGCTRWPYVWLEVKDVPLGTCVPSPSPCRLLAGGGEPPYRWSLVEGALPDCVTLDEKTGEFLGICRDRPSTYRLTIQVSDARGEKQSATLTLAIEERPTRWVEEAAIGGLIHGSRDCPPDRPHGDPAEQARQMKAEGYGYAMPATGWKIDRNAWDALSANKVIAAPLAHHGNLRAARAEKDAFASAGVRFGVYVGLPDEVKRTFSMKSIDDNGVVAEKIDCPDWLLYQDVLLDYLSRLARDLQPAVYFLDGINWARRNKLTWMIDVRGVSADPVSTIVAVELGR